MGEQIPYSRSELIERFGESTTDDALRRLENLIKIAREDFGKIEPAWRCLGFTEQTGKLEEKFSALRDRIAELEAELQTMKAGWESVKEDRDNAWVERDEARGILASLADKVNAALRDENRTEIGSEYRTSHEIRDRTYELICALREKAHDARDDLFSAAGALPEDFGTDAEHGLEERIEDLGAAYAALRARVDELEGVVEDLIGYEDNAAAYVEEFGGVVAVQTRESFAKARAALSPQEGEKAYRRPLELSKEERVRRRGPSVRERLGGDAPQEGEGEG